MRVSLRCQRSCRWWLLAAALLGLSTLRTEAATLTRTVSPGVTALSGQVLTAAGKPLANVLLEDGGAAARTDEAGRFLLLFVPPWRSVLTIDGTRAGTRTATDYGYYQVQVMAAPHVTTALPFTSYLTPIDHAHEVTIASPTTAEVVVRTPLVPGYELHIPPGTIITDPHGRRVDKISITPIPVDRPPFPLPRIGNFPLYLTLQPGGAQLWTTSGKRVEAKVWYPNLGGAPPGTRRVFWHYVPATFGWVPYGEGAVSADRKHVIPDAGIGTYAFMGGGLTGGGGAVAPAGLPNPSGGGQANGASGGEPVDLATGLFMHSETDLAISDALPISVTRTYLSSDNNYRLFGVGMSLSYEMYMIAPPEPPGQDYAAVQVVAPSLGSVTMPNVAGPNFGTYTNAIFMAGSSPGPFFQSRMTWNGAGWNLTRTEGTSYVFGFQQPLQYIQDRFGNRISLAFQQVVPTPQGQQSGPLELRPVQITSPNGRYIQLSYEKITTAGLDGRAHYGIVSATDDLGRATSYGYDSCGRLTSVTNADGGVTQYGWSPQATCGSQPMTTFSTLTTITSPNASATSGPPVLTNAYCPTGGDTNCPPTGGPGSIQGRVERQMLAQTGSKVPTYFFSYAADSNNNIYQATVSDPLGKKRIVDFSTGLITGPHCAAGAASTPPPPYTAGYPIADCEAVNNSQVEQDTIYARDASTNLIDSMTDALKRVTDWSYDSLGNVLSLTQQAVSPAVTTSFTYASPFSQVATITDPLGDITTFTRNGLGETTAITDANNNTTNFTYTAEGQVASVTDALGNETSYGYSFGDLASVTDPLNRTWSIFTDVLGRPVTATDPLGAVTTTAYDNLYGIASLTDPNGNATSFSYDKDGNLLSVTDARSNITGFAYDARDRLITRTDPLRNAANFSYDDDSNLVQVIDRKNQASGFAYDALNRLVTAEYCTMVPAPVPACTSSSTNLQASVAYAWDAGNRLLGIQDLPAGVTVGGTVVRGYDGLDRLTSETTTPPGTSTALGTVSYTYGPGSRPETMSATNNPAVAYTFDPGNRLTAISSGGTEVVCIGYDGANRRTALVLPDSVSAGYAYDNASELTGLTYSQGGSFSPQCTAGTGTTLGTLAYTYDNVGRRASATGTLFSSVVPTAFSSTTYNANNQLTKLTTPSGTINPTWDANGNLMNDGTSTYTWDARNRLLAVGSLASFTYDAAGRRLSVTPGGGSAQYYLYDRLNPVAIFNASGTMLGQPLTGLNLDERFSATASGVTLSYLTDALGSIVALASPSGGNLPTTYAYAPFGAAQASGASNPNPFQFIGRENDPTGLYYLRARYYNPAWGRFISEDPIGLNGGINVYAYAGNNPLNLIDPWGLSSTASQITLQAMYENWGYYASIDQLGYAGLTADDVPWAAVGATNSSWSRFGVNAAQTVEFSGWANAAFTNVAGDTSSPATVQFVRYNENQSAVIDLAQRYRRGLTLEQGQILMDWANEYGLPARLDPTHGGALGPHFHIGPIGHIPLIFGQ